MRSQAYRQGTDLIDSDINIDTLTGGTELSGRAVIDQQGIGISLKKDPSQLPCCQVVQMVGVVVKKA